MTEAVDIADQPGVHAFFPERRRLPKGYVNDSPNAITKAQFDKMIEDFKKEYEPIIKSHDARFHITNAWDDDTINAYAHKSQRRVWLINLKGGIGRLKEVTKDGVLSVLCHELGHLIGGYPQHDVVADMANEGQSDYFSGHACMTRIFSKEPAETAKSRQTATPYAKEVCDAVHKTQADQNLCYRIVMAGYNIFYAAYLVINDEKLPKWGYDNRDKSVVDATYHAHPQPQCRFDTYVSAATCLKKWDDSKIPTEAEDDTYSCNRGTYVDDYRVGVRPLCWFKPAKTGGTVDPRGR